MFFGWGVGGRVSSTALTWAGWSAGVAVRSWGSGTRPALRDGDGEPTPAHSGWLFGGAAWCGGCLCCRPAGVWRCWRTQVPAVPGGALPGAGHGAPRGGRAGGRESKAAGRVGAQARRLLSLHAHGHEGRGQGGAGGGGHADRHGWSVRGECADAACLPAAAGGLAAVPGLSLARAPSPPYAAQWGACCMASAALGVRAKLRRAAMTLSACRRSPPPPSPLPALAPLAPPPILPASLLSPGHPQAAAPHPELHPDGVEPQPLLQLARAPHRAAAQAVERDHQPVRGRVAQQ